MPMRRPYAYPARALPGAWFFVERLKKRLVGAVIVSYSEALRTQRLENSDFCSKPAKTKKKQSEGLTLRDQSCHIHGQ